MYDKFSRCLSILAVAIIMFGGTSRLLSHEGDRALMFSTVLAGDSCDRGNVKTGMAGK